MGVMTTKEQIRNAQGPSLKLPSRANPFETAGRTNNIVDEPVIAKTVQMSTISRYHFAVQRSGIGLGPENVFQNFEIREASFVAGFTNCFILLIFPFWEFIFPDDRRRRPMIFCLVTALYSIADVLGC